MKHSSVAVIVGLVLIFVFGAAVIFHSHYQPLIKKKSVLVPQNQSVSYVLYSEKDNGKELEVASNTVLIIQLPKADFEQVQAEVATSTPIDIKYEDVGESATASFTLKGNNTIQITAKSHNQHKPDFALTVKSH